MRFLPLQLRVQLAAPDRFVPRDRREAELGHALVAAVSGLVEALNLAPVIPITTPVLHDSSLLARCASRRALCITHARKAGIRAPARDTLSPVQAVVLVGGEGTRLRPLTLETPKPMVPVMNMPFLERTLRRLKDAGIDDVILPAGYLPEAITSYFGDGSPPRAASAVRRRGDAARHGRRAQERRAVHRRNVLRPQRRRAHVARLARHDALPPREGRHRQRCTSSASTTRARSAASSTTRPAAWRRSSRSRRAIRRRRTKSTPAPTCSSARSSTASPPDGPVSIERETFPQLIAEGRPLYAFTTDDYWIDLGKPEAYLSAHRHIFDAVMPLGLRPEVDGPGRETIPPSAVRPPVFIGAGCRVDPNAVIGPYTVLGDGCTIGAGAVVADSLLWDGVVVEAGANLEWAIVASRARIGAGAVVGRGAVIGHDSQIPAGSTIAENARVANES